MQDTCTAQSEWTSLHPRQVHLSHKEEYDLTPMGVRVMIKRMQGNGTIGQTDNRESKRVKTIGEEKEAESRLHEERVDLPLAVCS
jgi:hypothetical protein